jgi:hypothetical protein
MTRRSCVLAEQRHLLDINVRTNAVRPGRMPQPASRVPGDVDSDLHHDIGLNQDGIKCALCPPPGTFSVKFSMLT